MSSGAVTLNVVEAFAPAASVNEDSPKVPQVELDPVKDNVISSSPFPWFSTFKSYVTSTSGLADCVSCPTMVIFGS